MDLSTDHAYAAGLLDGEGCVSVADNGAGYIVLHISVGMKKDWAGAIRWLAKTFPEGHLSESLAGPNKCHMLYWQVSGHSAGPFLRAVLPFVQTKRRNVEVALAFLEIPKNSRADHDRLTRILLAEELRNRKDTR